MTLHADLKTPLEIGNGPQGVQTIFDVTGGPFEGKRLSGKVLTSGADWLLFDADGVGHLDVPITLETQDGAHIYVQYYGVIYEPDLAALDQGGSTDYGDTYFMTKPHFETGDSRYKWLNGVMAVAEGCLKHGAVQYRVFDPVNG